MKPEVIELIVALKGHTLPKKAENAYNRLCKAMESMQSDKTSDAEKQAPVAYMGTDIEGNPNKFRLNPFGGSIPLYTKTTGSEA